MRRQRARAGVRIGRLEPGPTNSIADIIRVGVGHVTVVRDGRIRPPGAVCAPDRRHRDHAGRARVAVRGRRFPSGARCSTARASSRASSRRRSGACSRPPCCSPRTMGVGRVFDGAVDVMLAADATVGAEDAVIPLVGECDDSWLSDGRSVQVEAADAGRAVAVARGAEAGPVVEGAVGAGTGMCCLGFKGGIGSARGRCRPVASSVRSCSPTSATARTSRSTASQSAANSKRKVGSPRDEPAGSCIVVLATDAADVVTRARAAGPARRARPRAHRLGRPTTAAVRSSSPSSDGCTRTTRRPRRPSGARVGEGPRCALQRERSRRTEEGVLGFALAGQRTVGREGVSRRRYRHAELLELPVPAMAGSPILRRASAARIASSQSSSRPGPGAAQVLERLAGLPVAQPLHIGSRLDEDCSTASRRC